jgi:FtsH-binding integral membrane protein
MEPRITIAAVVAISVIFGGAMVGVFFTKIEGFGKYTTSLLVLILALFVGSLAFAIGKIESQPFMSLLFAVVGYAGGLIVGKEAK